MSLNKIIKIWNTLAFRLTLGYAGIFIFSSLIVFVILYALTTSTIQRRMDQHLLNEIKEFASLLAIKGGEEVKSQIVLEAESEGVDKEFFRLKNTKN